MCEVFEAVKRKVKICSVKGLRLPVISIDGLIKMKAKTGRAVDKYEGMPAARKLEWLEEMRRFTSSLPKKTQALRRKVRAG